MKSQEQEPEENEAEDLEEDTPPDFWLIQMLREMFGGPDEDKAE